MDDQGEIIEFLSRPASYGAGAAGVERIETHASIVFLVGERAYKLKRAVRYSYLDYSTVALRRRACFAELALNRRTAPQLYLAVRPLFRAAAGGLVLGPGASAEADALGTIPAALDWVVEMRRFDQAQLFDRMAERRALTPALMRELTDEIVRFHREAEKRPDHGGAQGLAAAIAGNDENLRLAAGVLDGAAVERLAGASRAALGRVGALLDRRRAAGLVRQCHGDLHLRNICLVGDRPTLFDGIEFSDDIACIDVLYDLAFLLMDLEHRGLGALANPVLNRYLDLTVAATELDRPGDAGGLAALPLFLSVRAATRAHVAAAAATRLADPASVNRSEDEARAYLGDALAHLREVPPRLVAIGGRSGTGKSSLAYRLAPGLGAPPGTRVLRSDVIRKRLMKVPPETRLPAAAYAVEVNQAVYEALCRDAAAALAAGRPVIADATFLDGAERDAIAAVARADGVPFTGLWLAAPTELLEARLAQRRGDASDATPEVMRRQPEPAPEGWRGLDAASGLDALAAAAERVLRREAARAPAAAAVARASR